MLLLSEGLVALVDGDHYRLMAGRLRELAHETRSPGIHRELTDIATRYDCRGDYFDVAPEIRLSRQPIDTDRSDIGFAAAARSGEGAREAAGAGSGSTGVAGGAVVVGEG